MNNHTLHINITVEQNQTILPRCLQILSRRGFTLSNLNTEILNDQEVILHCILSGPGEWHATIPKLLDKLVDVKKVEKVDTK